MLRPMGFRWIGPPIRLAALIFLFSPCVNAQPPAPGQVESGEAGAFQNTPEAPPLERRRIIPHPIKRSAALSVIDGLKYPFSQFGVVLDKGLRKFEREHMLERMQDLQQFLFEKGYQPLLGGLGTGAGFSLGVNIFRQSFLGTGVRLDVPIQYSTNGYAGAGTDLTFPLLPDERLFLKTGFEYQDRPQEDFFGLGPLSSKANRSNFELEKKTLSLTLGSRPGKNLVVGFPVRLFNANVSRGTDERFPDLQDRFHVSRIAGAQKGAELISAGAFVEWDYRNSAAHPSAGGIWRLESSYFRDIEAQDFRFTHYALETAHYLSLDDEHVLAFRALGIFNDEKGTAAVPFFMKAILGGKETMRGFREFRFYDDNALLFSVEYRWQLWKLADAVLFVDEGQVAREPGDFSIRDLRNSHGMGLRFKSERLQMGRVDIGHSKEGWRFYVSFSPTF